MRVGIVGSRNFRSGHLVTQFVSGLPQGTVVITGGARGVDTVAETAATAHGLTVVVHLPDWETHGRKAGPLRNTKIVEDSDQVVAFWDGSSRGTQDTINKARCAGKLLAVHRSETRKI